MALRVSAEACPLWCWCVSCRIECGAGVSVAGLIVVLVCQLRYIFAQQCCGHSWPAVAACCIDAFVAACPRC
jgi:hypothetical protein